MPQRRFNSCAIIVQRCFIVIILFVVIILSIGEADIRFFLSFDVASWGHNTDLFVRQLSQMA